MNLKTIIGTFVVGMLLVSCAHSDNRLTVNVSQEVVTSGYIGNGVEWDPYDEAESWGASVSDEDWQKLFKRLDFMRMGYVLYKIPIRKNTAVCGSSFPARDIP